MTRYLRLGVNSDPVYQRSGTNSGSVSVMIYNMVLMLLRICPTGSIRTGTNSDPLYQRISAKGAPVSLLIYTNPIKDIFMVLMLLIMYPMGSLRTGTNNDPVNVLI